LIPLGLCQCGCGQPTAIAKKPNRRYGHLKGKPVRWVNGHNTSRPLADRFWKKVDLSVGLDACCLFSGSIDSGGYGQISVNGRTVGAHVVSWDLSHPGEPIPPGQWVLHRCDVRVCVRPDHLFLGPPPANVADMVAKGRQAHGERQGSAKLTEAQVREIRRVHAEEGLGYHRLASRFSVGKTTVRAIILGRTWKHLAAKAT